MNIKSLVFFILPFFLIACSGEEPDEEGLFRLTMSMEADAEVAMGIHSADVTINGYPKDINVSLVGNYDSYSISDNLPEWLTVTPSDKHFNIAVAKYSGSEYRVGKVAFTVFKGEQSQAGVITITQKSLTTEDLKKTERKAMKAYISKFDVISELPPLNDMQIGSVAPFYKLDADGLVYMQVVKMGIAPVATQGEKVYFRFLRYNLLSYLQDNRLPNGVGNMNDITANPASIVLGSAEESTTQYGTAIQMPLLLGLPADCEVNLVVASEAGFTSEISNVIPFLYNICYHTATF